MTATLSSMGFGLRPVGNRNDVTAAEGSAVGAPVSWLQPPALGVRLDDAISIRFPHRDIAVFGRRDAFLHLAQAV
jgi:hypothetical protein